jgi:hypothetical protein
MVSETISGGLEDGAASPQWGDRPSPIARPLRTANRIVKELAATIDRNEAWHTMGQTQEVPTRFLGDRM